MCILLSSLFLALSLSLTHTHSKTACLKVGGRSRVSISGKLPEEASGTGNLLPLPFSNLSKTLLSGTHPGSGPPSLLRSWPGYPPLPDLLPLSPMS